MIFMYFKMGLVWDKDSVDFNAKLPIISAINYNADVKK
jgi:hypothetical protein